MATIFPTSPTPQVDDEYQGYKWDGTSWNLVGNTYNPASYSTSAPANPKPGDIWIESDVDVPSISPETILTTTTAASTYQPLVSGVSSTEIGYLDGVTSAIQTQLNAKQTLEDSGWINVSSLSNNFTAPTTVAYRKLNGVVYLRGNLFNGTANTGAFTLPTGYRPSVEVVVPVQKYGTADLAYVTVGTNGVVLPNSTAAWLSGVCFPIG
jgi:hypothetical protein